MTSAKSSHYVLVGTFATNSDLYNIATNKLCILELGIVAELIHVHPSGNK